MLILVANWTNWLGYHVINELLAMGYTVHGLVRQSEDCSHFFAHFFIRNNFFAFMTDDDLEQYNDVIVIGDELLHGHPEQRIWRINCPFKTNHGKCIDVSTPILFGEWMPLNERGIFYDREFIAFTAERFTYETLDVKVFMKIFHQWLISTIVPHKIILCTNDDKAKEKSLILENLLYVRDNRPKHKAITRLKTHYNKYRHLYTNR